jgi:hypothetical protein
MTKTNKTSRLILNEMERLASLSGDELKSYISELRAALRREYKAHNKRLHRLYPQGENLSPELSPKVSPNLSPSTKEERSEKENFSPTPPLREKAKKEENAHPSGVRAARAHAREDVPDLATVLSLAPNTGVSEDYARWWHSEMAARDWTSPNGSRITLANWRSVMRAWYLRRNDAEVDAAKRMAIRLILPRPTKKSGYPLAAWDLCRERCANCGKKGCKVGIPTPPPSENPPRPPEECCRFIRIGKEAR